jgi:hypothetical protein
VAAGFEYDVFLSYSTKDRAECDVLYEGLRAAGLKVWRAPESIPKGADWPAAIPGGVERSGVFVLFFTEAAAASAEVAREVLLAGTRAPRMPIVQIRRANVPLPQGLKYYLTAPQWYEATHGPLEDHVAAIVVDVRSALGEAATLSEEAVAALEAARRRRFQRRAAGLVLVAPLVAATVWSAHRLFDGVEPENPPAKAAAVEPPRMEVIGNAGPIDESAGVIARWTPLSVRVYDRRTPKDRLALLVVAGDGAVEVMTARRLSAAGRDESLDGRDHLQWELSAGAGGSMTALILRGEEELTDVFADRLSRELKQAFAATKGPWILAPGWNVVWRSPAFERRRDPVAPSGADPPDGASPSVWPDALKKVLDREPKLEWFGRSLPVVGA